MSFDLKQRERRKAVDWLAATDWQVFGTLKFTDGFNIKDKKAQAIVRRFFSKLDRLYLGANAVSAGHRLERAVFEHRGTSGRNLHYHFVAKPNVSVVEFCNTARCIWGSLDSWTMGYENTQIESVRDIADAVGYGLHEYGKQRAKTLCLPVTHMHQTPPVVKPIYRFRRLLKQDALNGAAFEAARTRQAFASTRKIAIQPATH